MRLVLLALCSIVCLSLFASAGSISRKEGVTWLYLKGSPYEMGLQHGTLMQEQIQQNIAAYIDRSPLAKDPVLGKRAALFRQKLPELIAHIPAPYLEEMRGVADGASVPFDKVIALNLFPELFHCMGVTVNGKATLDGSLYHLRVLDYSIGGTLPQTAVIQFYQPDEGIPFVNISYAGFIGSITGMNSAKIAIGEIGGGGYGKWEGVPMPFLLRMVLQTTQTLEEAIALLREQARTCEYYYVLSDGNSSTSVGIYATPGQLKLTQPGESYALLDPSALPPTDDKYWIAPCTFDTAEMESILYNQEGRPFGFLRRQPNECLLIAGFNTLRYRPWSAKITRNYGQIDANMLQKLAVTPDINAKSNLQNVIFHPQDLTFWVSLAPNSDEPAYSQPYHKWNLSDFFFEQN